MKDIFLVQCFICYHVYLEMNYRTASDMERVPNEYLADCILAIIDSLISQRLRINSKKVNSDLSST